MDTTITVERMDEDEDLPSHEILRENLTRKRKRKTRTYSNNLECYKCGKISADRGSLQHHIQTHSKVCQFECRLCPYKGKTKKYLSRHVRRIHNGPPTKNVCNVCGKAFRYQSGLLIHQRVHTGEKPYECDVCGKSFSSQYSWKTHKYLHTDEKPFKCPYCDYACRDTSTLRKHRDRHTGTLKKYPCEICAKQFDSKHRLSAHVHDAHTGMSIKKFKCQKCNSAFKKESLLKRHTETVHDRSRTCPCPICGVTLSSYYNLKSHMRRHLDHRPYKCSVSGCTSTFKERSALKKHNAIHDMSRHVICDICGKTFSRKSRLVTHLSQHQPRAKREECLVCGVKFYTKQYLVKHMTQKHSRKKQKYICDMCDFVTYNKPSIVMHIKYGHNLGKGSCKICDKKYKRNVHLRLHYWNTHGIRFKTNARMNVLPNPEMEVTIKEEPLDCSPDLEFDEIDIETEEFLGFEPTEYEKSLRGMCTRSSEQSLTDFLRQVIHTPEDTDLKQLNQISRLENTREDPQSKQTTIEAHEITVEEILQLQSAVEAETLTKEDLSTSIDNLAVKIKEDQQTSRSVAKIEEETTNTEDLQEETNLDEEFMYHETNVEDTGAKDSEINKQLMSEDDIKEELIMDDASSYINEEIDTEYISEVERSNEKHSETIDCMPVEEFIQRVIEDGDETQQDIMVIDEAEKQAADSRLRELLGKMKRMDSGKLGVLKPNGGRIQVLTPEEIEHMKNRKRTKVSESKNTGEEERSIESETGKKAIPGSLKSIWNMHQCYVCFKLFQTKPKLIDHCKQHFDVCNETTLKKCPLCSFVTTKSDIKIHIKRKHHEDIDISFMKIKDRKDNATGSRYYYDTKNEKIKELEIIPSIKILNKKASMELDKRNRERNNKFVGKRKLVRKGNEWIVEKEKLDLSDHVLPDSKDLDRNSENYLELIKKLGKEAKRKGVKMLYPCNRCDKICQNLSALTLHGRRHDPNPKPFRPRGSTNKDEEMREKMIAKCRNTNRTAKPKPIVNNHKCDPKLMDFYEKNIKGGDIEFWQFLKIYNKMDKEKVNSFQDLEATTEFGIHFDDTKVNLKNVADNNIETDSSEAINKIKPKSNGSNKKVYPKGLNRRFVRTIRISKVEYNRRLAIKNRMRDKLASDDTERS